jgi:hypothetical protein
MFKCWRVFRLTLVHSKASNSGTARDDKPDPYHKNENCRSWERYQYKYKETQATASALHPLVHDWNIAVLPKPVGAYLINCLLLTWLWSWLKNSVASFRKRTIPTERPPLVGEVSVNFFADRGCHVVSVTDPYGRILDFLGRSRYFFFQVAPKL